MHSSTLCIVMYGELKILRYIFTQPVLDSEHNSHKYQKFVVLQYNFVVRYFTNEWYFQVDSRGNLAPFMAMFPLFKLCVLHTHI